MLIFTAVSCLVVTHQKEGCRATESSDSATGVLTPVYGFETMQEEEDKIQTPLFLIGDPWRWAFIFYKPLDSSWRGEHISWGRSLLCSPLCWLRIKGTFLFRPDCLCNFYSALVGSKSQILGQQRYLCFLGYHLLEIPFFRPFSVFKVNLFVGSIFFYFGF